jgi:hypothetical protein
MEAKREYTRPAFETVLHAWKGLLQERALPPDLLWVFEENLCFEPDPARPEGFRLGFQTTFTPPPLNAESVAYDYFSEFDAPLVFYRLGSAGGKSVCIMLCDPWFAGRRERDGFVQRPDWLIAFRPGEAVEVEEIKDKGRWKHRLVRNRPLHDLDFSMTLQAVHECLAHGRVLSTYERYALKLLHIWHRALGQKK